MNIKKDNKDMSKTERAKQMLLGTFSGCATGYVFLKMGKLLIVAVGGTIVLFQLGNEQGYVKVNWKRVYRKLEKVSDNVEEKLQCEGKSYFEKIAILAQNHVAFTGGFIGGFLLAAICA